MKLKNKDEKYYFKCILFELMKLGCAYIFLPIPFIYIYGGISGIEVLVHTAMILLILLVLYIVFAILAYKKEKCRVYFNTISAISFIVLILLFGYLFTKDSDIIWKIFCGLRIFIFLIYIITLVLTENRAKSHIACNAIFGTILIMFSFNPIEIPIGIYHLMETSDYSKFFEDDEKDAN